jgi:hypothetical protein
MTIRYNNGPTLEAVILSRTDATMRLAIEGHDDIVELNRVHDVWISAECEPVQVGFSWTGRPGAQMVAEDDCVCSHEMAAHLIRLLYSADEGEAAGAPPVPRSLTTVTAHQVV